MRLLPRARPLPSALVLAVALVAGACGATGPTTPPAASGATGATTSPVATATAALTPVPGGQTIGPDTTLEPKPAETRIPITKTPWGEILDALPESFPIYPGASTTDVGEAVSAAFAVPVDAEMAATWYHDALTAKGYAVDVANALEDGSRVLDAQGDLPECRIQMTFRPEADSTIMTVLYAAGCAAGG
ncbi:MAG: hypothetical protein ABIR11_11290 [Candidatus Limnocylindrales bacterium]